MDTTTDSADKAVENVADTVPPLSVGKTLREARLSQGMSIADVADSIKFAPRQVEALEADDYSHLPELAFVRGFVRSYARLLHIDEAALLNELPAAHQKLSSFRADLADVPLSAAQSTRRINVAWLSGALGLALILGIGVWLSQKDAAPQKAVTSPITIVPIEPAASSVAAASGAVAAPLVVAASAVSPVSPLKPAASSVVAAKPLLVLPASAVAPVTKLTHGRIRLVFDTESWVDIKDKYGKTIFKQVNPPNTEQWVDGRAPFSLVIGNASGVRLYYEGEEVDLDEFINVEVARLILEE